MFIPEKETCRSCKFYKSKKWHDSLGGKKQLNGTCQLLLETMRLSNIVLFMSDEIIVCENFGCNLYKPIEWSASREEAKK